MRVVRLITSLDVIRRDYYSFTLSELLSYYLTCWRTRRNLKRRSAPMNLSEMSTQAGRVGALLISGQAEKIGSLHKPGADLYCVAGCGPAPCVWQKAARTAMQVERDVNSESAL